MNRLERIWLTLMLLTVAYLLTGWWESLGYGYDRHFLRDSLMVFAFIVESLIAMLYILWRKL